MRLSLSLGLAVCVGFTAGATTVTNLTQVRMYCLSVHVEPGIGELFGLRYTVSLFSGTPTAPNGELYPLLPDEADAPTHDSFFVLETPDLVEPLVGELLLAV